MRCRSPRLAERLRTCRAEAAGRRRKDGLKVWFEEWVLRPGDSIPGKIEEGMEHSQFAFEPSAVILRHLLNGSLARFLHINWRPAEREQLGLEARKKMAQGKRSETSSALGQQVKKSLSPERATATPEPHRGGFMSMQPMTHELALENILP